MAIYCDSSALVKRYLYEAETSAVQKILEQEEDICTSALTPLELTSAIEVAKRIRRINSPDYRTAFGNLEKDLHQGTLTLIDISPAILKKAGPLIRIRHLRAPDALQLATALELNRHFANTTLFLCADQSLLAAARKEGLRCRDVSA